MQTTGAVGGSLGGRGDSGMDAPLQGTGGAISIVPDAGGSARSTGGVVGSGGARSTGGAVGSGGIRSTGGAVGSGGATGTGGAVSTGGAIGTGGATGTGGNGSASIRLLHHSTGGVIWNGGLASWIAAYNAAHGTSYAISETDFPKDSPYGWNNYPYDYWNIWVDHAGDSPYVEEPTLEILTQQYKLIIWKHCFPVSNVEADTGMDITSSRKSLENYEAQYAALKEKMHQFPSNLFLVWTGAALRESETSAAQASRAQAFAQWVTEVWDEPDDNIFVWDFRALETGGGLYLLPENAEGDSHPNETFAAQVAPFLGKRIVDVLEGRGDTGSLTGQ